MKLMIANILSVLAPQVYFYFSKRSVRRKSKSWSRPACETLAVQIRILCELKALRCYLGDCLRRMEAEIANMERTVAETDYPQDLKEYALQRIANLESEKQRFLSTLSELLPEIKYMGGLVDASREAAEEEAQTAKEAKARERAVRVCMA
jgi:hypothetical protein